MAGAHKIRVMVVDDSVVVRGILSEVIAADPDLEVAGVAPNGAVALERLPQFNPDLVVLDIEMPELDGLETLSSIRRQHPRLPVVMFSTLTERGAVATVEALTRGASDYVTKPSGAGGAIGARQAVRDQLIPKIKHLCTRPPGAPPRSGLLGLPAAAPPRAELPGMAAGPARPAPAAVPAAVPAPPAARALPLRTAKGRIEVVVIGVSTGGPNALARVLPELPADLPVPVLIVQHMPAGFTALLADRLAKAARLPVKEAAGGERLAPQKVWLAPGGHHLEIAGGVPGWGLRLTQAPVENSCRPAADVLFRSAARAFGPAVLAVVMTGMGQDGQKGCEVIRAAGGQVIAQDEATSVVWGMPGSVVRAGLTDKGLPLEQIAGEITKRVRAGRDPSARA